MKKITFAIGFILLALNARCQPDKTFTKPVKFQDTIYVITIVYPDGTIQNTATTGTGTVTWDAVTGKPIFSVVATTGKFSDLLNIPAAFTPTAHRHKWSEIDEKPPEKDLSTSISQLQGISTKGLTTAEINAIINPSEGFEVYDRTLHVKKFWNGTIWKIIATTN
jgi:hypothetical protein